MPAKTFFAMLEKGERAKMVETSKFLYDLLDVVTYPHAQESWRKEEKQYLWNRVSYYDDKPAKPIRRGLAVKHEDAAKILISAFALKAKVEGIHVRRTK